MTQSVTIPTSASAFDLILGEIAKKGAEVQDAIQRAAVAAILFTLGEDRNVEPARQLLKVLPSGQRKDALVAYLEAHGNMMWSKVDKTIKFYDAVAAGQVKAKSADELYAIKWDTAKKAASPVSMYDAVNEVDRLIQRLQKLAKEGHLEHPSLIKAIALAKAKWTGENADLLYAESEKAKAADEQPEQS
jgi:hypothetical protein